MGDDSAYEHKEKESCLCGGAKRTGGQVSSGEMREPATLTRQETRKAETELVQRLRSKAEQSSLDRISDALKQEEGHVDD